MSCVVDVRCLHCVDIVRGTLGQRAFCLFCSGGSCRPVRVAVTKPPPKLHKGGRTSLVGMGERFVWTATRLAGRNGTSQHLPVHLSSNMLPSRSSNAMLPVITATSAPCPRSTTAPCPMRGFSLREAARKSAMATMAEARLNHERTEPT